MPKPPFLRVFCDQQPLHNPVEMSQKVGIFAALDVLLEAVSRARFIGEFPDHVGCWSSFELKLCGFLAFGRSDTSLPKDRRRTTDRSKFARSCDRLDMRNQENHFESACSRNVRCRRPAEPVYYVESACLR